MIKREEIIGDCRLILGDCLEVMPSLGKVDAVVTDPPYGVMLGDVRNGQARDKNQQPYTMFVDSEEYIKSTVVPGVELFLSISDRAIITPGNRNAFLYPKPDDIGVWYNPAGTGRGKWGYLLAHMILYYGKDPRAGQSATASSITGKNDPVGKIKNKLHPCPKPILFSEWMINKVGFPGETILDPFMGSGTTGVACVNLGRKFIGIELEEKYFDIACKRIDQANRQGKLFTPPKQQPKPQGLF